MTRAPSVGVRTPVVMNRPSWQKCVCLLQPSAHRRRGARVMRGWLKFAFIALLALLATPQCRAEEHEMPDFKTMKIKELKAILADRGQECRGCAEKADYVAMAADVWSLPIVEKPASGDETKEKPAEPDLNDADQERIRRMMDEMQNGPRPTGDPERDAISTPPARHQVLRRRGHAPGPAPEPGEGHGEHQDQDRGRGRRGRGRDGTDGRRDAERAREIDRWRNGPRVTRGPADATGTPWPRLSRSLRSFRSRRRRRVSDPVLDDDDE